MMPSRNPPSPLSLPVLLIMVGAAAVVAAGCSGPPSAAPSSPDRSTGSTTKATAGPRPDSSCSQADEIAELSVGRRITQVLFAGVDTDVGPEAIDRAGDAITSDRVGGMNFLGNNPMVLVGDPLADVVAAAGPFPPFLAADEEGGQVQRLEGLVDSLPPARIMAQTRSPDQVKRTARQLAQEMQRHSLNVDFAPVADVGDGALGNRVFATDPGTVTQYAGAFAAGLRSGGVIPTLKHFPGMGKANANTDFAAATTPPLSQLRDSDLLPYRELANEEPLLIMVAHAVVPGLTDGRPASMAPATYELLRDDIGFEGPIITDSLGADAILRDHTTASAVEAALIAGADIALWDNTEHIGEVRARLRSAVREGRLSHDRLNEAVGRVLALKGVDLCDGS